MHIRNKISNRALFLFTMDLKRLRSMYRMIEIDIPSGLLQGMKRKDVVTALINYEFNENDIIEYRGMCMQMNEMKDFVEKGIRPEV